MSPLSTRMRIENEGLGRLEKRLSEEEQANHLMSLLMDNYPLHAVGVLYLESGRTPLLFAHRGHSGNFIKELYARGTLPVLEAAAAGEVVIQGADPRLSDAARFEHEANAVFGGSLGKFSSQPLMTCSVFVRAKEAKRPFSRDLVFCGMVRWALSLINSTPSFFYNVI